MLLDNLMPGYEFSEIHRIIVPTPPVRALDAVMQVTPGEMPLARLLFGIRSLPAILGGGRGLVTAPSKPLYQQLVAMGFVVLAEEPGRELVVGIVGAPWRISGGRAPKIDDAAGFRDFAKPGFMKAALGFFAEPSGNRCLLRTDTRILTTDPDSYRRFRRYWWLVRPGSALIRRRWLQAANRRIARDASPLRATQPKGSTHGDERGSFVR